MSNHHAKVAKNRTLSTPAKRSIRQVHPRGDKSKPPAGVFAARVSLPTNHVIPQQPKRLGVLISSWLRALTWTILHLAPTEIRAMRLSRDHELATLGKDLLDYRSSAEQLKAVWSSGLPRSIATVAPGEPSRYQYSKARHKSCA